MIRLSENKTLAQLQGSMISMESQDSRSTLSHKFKASKMFHQKFWAGDSDIGPHTMDNLRSDPPTQETTM